MGPCGPVRSGIEGRRILTGRGRSVPRTLSEAKPLPQTSAPPRIPGARAVLIGRPYVYGPAVAGRAGVREVLKNLPAEFDLTMGLAGYRSTDELSVDAPAPRPA